MQDNNNHSHSHLSIHIASSITLASRVLAFFLLQSQALCGLADVTPSSATKTA
jgi:hypothetical protein